MNGASLEKFNDKNLRRIVGNIMVKDSTTQYIGAHHTYFLCHRKYALNRARKIVSKALNERRGLYG